MDILEEAKNELKQQKLYALIKRYYKAFFIIIALVLGVVSTSVYLDYRKTKKYEKLSKQYYDLFVMGKLSDKLSDSSFGELIKFRDTAFMTFAEFQYVELALKSGKQDRAVQILFDLINNTKVNPELSNVMKIRLAGIVMQYKLKPHYYKVIDILTKATKKEQAPYYNALRLLLGQLLVESDRQHDGIKVLKELYNSPATTEDIKFFSNVILSNYLE